MADETVQYKCPECGEDMTALVCRECAQEVAGPLAVRLLARFGLLCREGHQLISKRPSSVSPHCKNKHWYEYPRPAQGGGKQ